MKKPLQKKRVSVLPKHGVKPITFWVDIALKIRRKIKMQNTKFEDFCVFAILVLVIIALSPLLISMFVVLFIVNLLYNRGNFKKAFKDTMKKG